MVSETIVRVLVAAMGEQILACYQTGSRLDGSAVKGSDYDFVIMFRGEVDSRRRNALEALGEQLSERLAVKIDLEARSEPGPNTSLDPVLKHSAKHLHGEDICAALPLLSIDEWARDRLHTTCYRAATLFGRPRPLTLPLAYPDPNDAFLGYVGAGDTRNLVRHVSWAATALIAHLGKTYVSRKADCAHLYREVVHDGYADFIGRLYQRCKIDWQYAIPQEHAELRELCIQTLEFENHVLAIYRAFLREELLGDNAENRAKAIWVLNKIPLEDAELQALSSAGEGGRLK